MSVSEDKLNMEIRKFLKLVGVTSQREIEKAVHEAEQAGKLGAGSLRAKMTLQIDGVNLVHVVEGEIDLR